MRGPRVRDGAKDGSMPKTLRGHKGEVHRLSLSSQRVGSVHVWQARNQSGCWPVSRCLLTKRCMRSVLLSSKYLGLQVAAALIALEGNSRPMHAALGEHTPLYQHVCCPCADQYSCQQEQGPDSVWVQHAGP